MECTNCEKGIKMCYNRPCFGTPEEFEKIIDAGFGNLLRIDKWIGRPFTITQADIDALEEGSPMKDMYEMAFHIQSLSENPFKTDVLMLSGGTNDDDDYIASYIPTGKCKLLTSDNKCSLHDLGLKPEQGRESCCNKEQDFSKNNLHYAKLWDTEEGKRVIEKFKKLIINKE